MNETIPCAAGRSCLNVSLFWKKARSTNKGLGHPAFLNIAPLDRFDLAATTVGLSAKARRFGSAKSQSV